MGSLFRAGQVLVPENRKVDVRLEVSRLLSSAVVD